jgi:hypothetical protein
MKHLTAQAGINRLLGFMVSVSVANAGEIQQDGRAGNQCGNALAEINSDAQFSRAAKCVLRSVALAVGDDPGNPDNPSDADLLKLGGPWDDKDDAYLAELDRRAEKEQAAAA